MWFVGVIVVVHIGIGASAGVVVVAFERDVLVIADSRLTRGYNVQQLEEKLNNYVLFARYDSEDNSKHMGLVGLCSKTSKLVGYLQNIETICFRLQEKVGNGSIETYIQGMTVKFKDYDLQVAFLYIRRKPNKEDILKIQENCEGSSILLGDLNLNPLNESEKKAAFPYRINYNTV